MIAYLTSHIGGSCKIDGKRVPTTLLKENGFLEDLTKNWKNNSNVLIISADPETTEINDSIKDIFKEAFPMSGLSVNQMIICDKRNEEIIDRIGEFDAIILSGGHVPTQNVFFERIKLKEHLEKFDGILMGISAGSMNSAEVVYAHPELEGEAVDENYKRFIPGLGLTKLMILPHYQDIKDEVLDGMRVFEDIAYPDSLGREFYCLNDGSYIKLVNGVTEIIGEAYLIKDGEISLICENNRSLLWSAK